MPRLLEQIGQIPKVQECQKSVCTEQCCVSPQRADTLNVDVQSARLQNHYREQLPDHGLTLEGSHPLTAVPQPCVA